MTEAVRAAVNDGAAPSADVFVEQALVAALRERRRERLYPAYADVAQEPAFVADRDDPSAAFDAAVSDVLKSSWEVNPHVAYTGRVRRWDLFWADLDPV